MSNEKWGVDNIPDLSGKVIIVTGANSGLGFEASKEFARKASFHRFVIQGDSGRRRIGATAPPAGTHSHWSPRFAKDTPLVRQLYCRTPLLVRGSSATVAPTGGSSTGLQG